jgi:hypothetical protein
LKRKNYKTGVKSIMLDMSLNSPEWGSPRMREWKARKVESEKSYETVMLNDTPKSPEWGFVVAPSVPDGDRNLSQSESSTPENLLHNGVQNV